jgi:hypothetical protein
VTAVFKQQRSGCHKARSSYLVASLHGRRGKEENVHALGDVVGHGDSRDIGRDPRQPVIRVGVVVPERDGAARSAAAVVDVLVSHKQARCKQRSR